MNQGEDTLKQKYILEIEDNTPQRIKSHCPINLKYQSSFKLEITTKQLLRNLDNPRRSAYSESATKEGLDLNDWLDNYKREAHVSEAGIRGPQNPLYHWDTRYPINSYGIFFSTLAKSLVAAERYPGKQLVKICSREVRYNSQTYLEMISRIQATRGIITLTTTKDRTMPVWMCSFLIFMLDLYGGEYITSSHSMGKKNATKDLNYQGSQYVPKESMFFVDKIQSLFDQIKNNGQIQFTVSDMKDKHINTSYLKEIKYGVPLYVDYLRKSIATDDNIKLISGVNNKIIIDVMHGCMYKTMSEVLSELRIDTSYQFLHKKEDPYFGGIGKYQDNSGAIIDYGLDTTLCIYNQQTNEPVYPVVESLNYGKLLKKYPVRTMCLMTDPDGDRLILSEIVERSRTSDLDRAGVTYINMDESWVLALFMPNQAFLLTLDYRMKMLKEMGVWEGYDWFMIKTSASARSWDEWAAYNQIKVINTPVGFRELALVMQKTEQGINAGGEVILTDIFGKEINVGKRPRVLFAGEESGGEMFGSPELIRSKSGREAVSMREKSAGEPIIILSALYGKLEKEGKYLFEKLTEIFDTNEIGSRYDVRVDHKYYNENEPDVHKLIKSKELGLINKEANGRYFFGLSLAYKHGLIDTRTLKEILLQDIPDLEWSDLIGIEYVGDGSLLSFSDMCVEVRPSGTDAINKAYGMGKDKEICRKYAKVLSAFNGERGIFYKKSITGVYFQNPIELARKLHLQYHEKGFTPQEYDPEKCAIKML